MNTSTKYTDLSEQFCLADLLFNKLTAEYEKLDCDKEKLEVLFELFIEELNNNFSCELT